MTFNRIFDHRDATTTAETLLRHKRTQQRTLEVLPFRLLEQLADRDELRVRVLVETRVFNIQRNTVEAAVAPHDGSRAILEGELCRILERVSVELCAVRLPEADGVFTAADDGVHKKSVPFLSPGIYHPRIIGPLVRVDAVSESGESGQHGN